MSGTKAGGRKASATNKKNYGEDFYKVIGAKGGRNGTTGGFYGKPEKARAAGAKGGVKSKIGYRILKETRWSIFYEHRQTGAILKVKKSSLGI